MSLEGDEEGDIGYLTVLPVTVERYMSCGVLDNEFVRQSMGSVVWRWAGRSKGCTETAVRLSRSGKYSDWSCLRKEQRLGEVKIEAEARPSATRRVILGRIEGCGVVLSGKGWQADGSCLISAK